MINPIRLFIYLSLSVVAGYLISVDPGVIYINYDHYIIKTSFWFGLALITLFFFAFHLLLRATHTTTRLKKIIQKRKEIKNLRNHRDSLANGLNLLAQGQWKKAAKTFQRGINYNDDPSANIIGLIEAKKSLPQSDELDLSLPATSSSLSKENIGVSLSKVAMLIEREKWTAAEKTCLSCYKVNPKNTRVLELLARIYTHTNQLEKLATLRPQFKKYHVHQTQEMNCIDIKLATNTLQHTFNLDDEWKKLPKSLREKPELLKEYCKILVSKNRSKDALLLIQKQLKRQWQPSLLACYAEYSSQNNTDDLLRAESWLSKKGNDPLLLRCLGQLSEKNNMLAKAEQYYKRSIEQKPSRESYLLLAELSEAKNKLTEANSYYKKALITESI